MLWFEDWKNAWWKGTHFCCGSSLPYYPRVSIRTEKTHTARQLIFTFSIKTQSSGGFRSSQRALWPWQTWKYHWPLSAIKSDNLKKQHHQELLEATRARLKLKIQLLADFCPPGMWHKICWYPWKVWKSVFQTNDRKELKTQGAECQGPVITLSLVSY